MNLGVQGVGVGVVVAESVGAAVRHPSEVDVLVAHRHIGGLRLRRSRGLRSRGLGVAGWRRGSGLSPGEGLLEGRDPVLVARLGSRIWRTWSGVNSSARMTLPTFDQGTVSVQEQPVGTVALFAFARSTGV